MSEKEKRTSREDSPFRKGRLVRLIVATGLIGLAGYAIYQRFFALVSENAVMAASLRTIRAPTYGELHFQPVAIGSLLKPGTSLARISDTTADATDLAAMEARSRIEETEEEALREQILYLSSKAKIYSNEAARTSEAHASLAGAAVREAEADVKAAAARLEAAQKKLERVRNEVTASVAPAADLDEAEQQQESAQADLAAADERLQRAKVALESAKAGRLLDNGERAYAQQKADELNLRVGVLEREKQSKEEIRKAVDAQRVSVRDSLERRLRAELKVPTRSRVWRKYASPETFVMKGDLLFDLLDCNDLFIAAVVRSHVITDIAIGTPVEVSVPDSSATYQGSVVQIVGPELGAERTAHSTLVAPGIARVLDTAAQRQENMSGVLIGFKSLPDALRESCEIGREVDVTFRP